MAFTADEFREKLTSVRNNLSDEGRISEILVELGDSYNEIIANIENTKNENDTLRSANENLRDSNMRLFLKLGKPEEKPEEKPKDSEGQDSFDDCMKRLKGKFI